MANDRTPLEILAQLPAPAGVPVAAVALEHMPVAASIVSAIRDDAGRIVDFRVEYSNLAASSTAPDRTEAYGKPLFELIPAFEEEGLREEFARVLETQQPYTRDGVRLTGSYQGIDYDVVLEVACVPLGDDLALSISYDRTEKHEALRRLGSVQDTLSRRAEMEQQIRAVNVDLVEELVNVQRALDHGDLDAAREHAARGAARAADVVTGLRGMIRTSRLR